MPNVSPGSHSAPANTGSGPAVSPSVATHVGGHKVRIDANALKHLINTIKAKLGHKARPAN